jgi:hypothetical protein
MFFFAFINVLTNHLDERGVLIISAVIPAKAGILYFNGFLDSQFLGSDGLIVLFGNPLFSSLQGMLF